MNYYDKYVQLKPIDPGFEREFGKAGNCCAHLEVYLLTDRLNGVAPAEAIRRVIQASINERRTWLSFYIIETGTSERFEDEVRKLPNICRMSNQLNPRSGSTIRYYHLNLRKEWK